MKYTLNAFLIVAAMFFANSAHAQYTFNNLSQSDLDDATREFSHDFLFTSVSGASSLGSIWGFELGVTGSMANSDAINSIVQRSDPNTKVDKIYDANLLGRLSLPGGFTVEAGLLPKIKIQQGDLSQFAAAVTYNIIELPVAVGVRAHYSRTAFSFSQNQGGFTGNIDYKSDVYGLQALVSQNFLVIEPYAGLGWAQGNGDMNATGSGFLFTSSNSGTSAQSSAELLAGVNLHLALFNIGAEYSRAFGTNKVSAKLSLGF